MSIMKRRIQRLYDKLETFNIKYPDLVQEVILKKKNKYNNFFHVVIEVEFENQINSIIESIATLSKKSKANITCELLDGFNKSKYEKEGLISTTIYGKKIGINAKPYLFEYLTDLNLIIKPTLRNKSYELTDEGHKYGDYLFTDDGEKYIGWNKSLLDKKIHPIVSDIIKRLDFKLYHLTHIINLKPILNQGLKCHNDALGYKDISNLNVNKRREREKRDYGVLHDYVPLYFNPRNAMLYQTCKQFNDQIIILEIKKEIIKKDYTVFSQGNAARRDSFLTRCKNKAASFDWDKIYSRKWAEIGSGIVDEEQKSMMMSECLIFKSIPSSYIKVAHCRDISAFNKVSELIKANIKEVQISPELYF